MGKKNKVDPVQQEENYVAFLKKRLDSTNYRANVTEEEYAETKVKYEKAKLRLKILKKEKK